MSADVEFGLLGPLAVRRDGEPLEVGRGKQRAVLAALLLRAGQVVPVEDLADLLWGTQPPASARVTVQNYVKRLRRALGKGTRDRITTHPGGYSITVAASELDVSGFEALVKAAGTAAGSRAWDEAAAQAKAALRLWRGEPFTDTGSPELAAREGLRLTELRLQAAETLLEAELHLGGHARVVPELRQLVLAHPLREHLHVLLMLALYRCGRQGEALAAYRGARLILVEEVGVEPGTELRALHQRILAGDLALAAPGTVPAEPVPSGPAPDTASAAALVPRQLPGVAAHFAGRTAELAALDGVLEQAGGEVAGTVVISAIGGTAGVGKTALAVYWAHRVAKSFRDGQLYVNLRGFDPSGRSAEPAEAIRGFLDALGVPVERVPANLDAQAGLYRSLLADKQLLIVLDNARDEEQVRPLLPPGPGCLTLITSRNSLTGLAAAEGARLLTLNVLTPAEARQMLAARLGRERTAAEPEALSEIGDLCAYLPTALAIAAAQAAARPRPALAALAEDLRASRLDPLDTGDPAVSVRGVFSWSYRGLNGTAQRMFRLLGLHPGPDISAAAAASLADQGVAETRRDLAELTRAHLLTERAPGRYAFHDLLRAYAAEQADSTDDDQARKAAIGRVLEHYLHTACAASHLLDPARDTPVTLTPPLARAGTVRLTSARDALAWFTAEYRVLRAAVSLAADSGFDACAWQLDWTIGPFLGQHGLWHELAAIQNAAVAAAARLDDTSAQAVSRCIQGGAFVASGDHEQADAGYSSPLVLYQRAGEVLIRLGEAKQAVSALPEA